jgi:hypothetical protein
MYHFPKNTLEGGFEVVNAKGNGIGRVFKESSGWQFSINYKVITAKSIHEVSEFIKGLEQEEADIKSRLLKACSEKVGIQSIVVQEVIDCIMEKCDIKFKE